MRTLGALSLQGSEGEEITAVVAQPKRFALLVYLATARPGDFHRRDALLSMFWPERDETNARNSLSQALSFLRKHLPEGALVSRGAEEVGLAPGFLTCDVEEFRTAISERRWAEALELHQGDFLHGFHLTGASAFGAWVELERERLREAAAGATWALARAQIERGALVEAERSAQRALELVYTDESPVREFVLALAEAGDRAAALNLYQKFCSRLKHELDLEPSATTADMAEAIRSVESSGGSARRSVVVPRWSIGSGALVTEGSETPRAEKLMARRKGGLAIAVAGVTVGLTSIAASLAPHFLRGPSNLDPDRVVVLPLDNRTGTPSLDQLEIMVADWIGEAIHRIPQVDLVPLTVSNEYAEEAPRESPLDVVRRVADRTGSGWAVAGTLALLGDSLEFRAELIDTRHNRRAQLVVEKTSKETPLQAVPLVAQRVGGALAFELDQALEGIEAGSSSLPKPPTLEAYREHQAGYVAFDRRDGEASFAHHMAAYALDTTFVRALVAATYVAPNRTVEDSLARMADARRYLLSQDGQFDLDIKLAMLDADWYAALRILREKVSRNANTFSSVSLAFFAILCNLPGEAVDALEGYDPYPEWRREGASSYWDYLTEALHMLGQHDRELEEARRGREQSPNSMPLLITELRALAALGKFEDLEGDLRQALYLSGDPTRAAIIAGSELRAHGHREKALEVFEGALERLTTGNPDNESDPGYFQNLTEAAYGAERWREAHQLARDWMSESPDNISAVGMVGVTAARLGDSDTAFEMAERLAGMSLPGRFGREAGKHLFWKASVLALLNRPNEAMSLLQDAVADGLRFGVDLDRSVDLESLREREDFQALLKPRG